MPFKPVQPSLTEIKQPEEFPLNTGTLTHKANAVHTQGPEGGADWLAAVECFYGVGGSALLHLVPLMEGRDMRGSGMSPLCFERKQKMAGNM